MGDVQTDCCGTKQDKYKLTCRNLASKPECTAGYNVTVVWDGSGSTWKYTDGDGCVSFLECARLDTNEWVYHAMVLKLMDGACRCFLEGQRRTNSSDMLATLPGVGCYCYASGSDILVEPA